MRQAPVATSLLGFVASEKSLCDELGISAQHCAANGQRLVISDDNALAIAGDLCTQYPNLQVRVDVGSWRRTVATAEAPMDDHDDVADLFGVRTWYEHHLPADGGIGGYTPSRFLRADDRAALRALLAQTTDLPGNIITRVAIDARVLEVSLRDDFLEDLECADGRRLAFIFAAPRDPLASYQRLDGLRRVLREHPGSEVDHVDPLVAAEALAHGASFAGVGASSSRRMPRRPGDKGGGPIAVGFLPGLFLEELLELRSPMIYADWYANSRSPYCRICGRSLDVFEPTAGDKAVIVNHNLHQVTSHIAGMLAQPVERRSAWLRQVRIEAHARHMGLNPASDMYLNLTLRRLLELDDPGLRSLSRAGIWE